MAAGVLAALYLLAVAGLVVAGRREPARAVAGFVPDCAGLLGRMLRDPRVARRPKLALGLAAAYVAMPIDLVPDFVPVAGQLDDAVVVACALRFALRGCDPGIVAEHWHGPESSLRMLRRLAGASPG
jgi:uncharacterized membrane protein YkvA (DUF1232 family)